MNEEYLKEAFDEQELRRVLRKKISEDGPMGIEEIIRFAWFIFQAGASAIVTKTEENENHSDLVH